MFKKITSNRDPKDTVFSELRKEFRPCFSKAGTFLKRWAERYPAFLFWMMVINITLSVILVATVYHPRPGAKKAIVKGIPVSSGIDQLLAASHQLKITLDLKKEVDSLFHLKQLSISDSAKLLADLDSLQHLQTRFKSKP